MGYLWSYRAAQCIASALHLRPIISVYHHVRRMWHPLRAQGKWTPCEDDALRSCVTSTDIILALLIGATSAIAQFGQQWEKDNIHPNVKEMYTDKQREEARERIARTVEKYSDELVEQWNKEIDGLLTFVRAARCTFAIPRTDRFCGYRLVFSLPSSLRSMCNHTSSCNQLLRIKRMRSSHRSPTSCPAFVPPPRL